MFRKIFFYAIPVFLLLFSWMVYKKLSRPSSIDKEERDFAVKDTASIDRIILTDKEKNRSELVRTRSGWVVNDKYPVRSDAILILLEAIKRVEVLSRVPKAMEKNIFRALSNYAIKVEIFSGRKKIKKYYVGGETPDGQGTYMLLSYPDEENENYPHPYITGIPGFVGFLTPRYITREEWWRSTEVIHYTPSEILSVKMINHEFPDSSFTLMNENGRFQLKNPKGEKMESVDFKIKQYLAYFTSLHIEMYFSEADRSITDSLLTKGKPFRSWIIKSKKGEEEEFWAYRRPVEPTREDEFKKYYSFDPERFFLLHKRDEKKEFSYAQYFVFGKLFVNNIYFLKD